MKPKIMQHCFGTLGSGGPIGGVKRILESELSLRYEFATCFQDRPAGGINLSLIYEMSRRIRSFQPDLLHVRGLGNEGFHGLAAGRLAGCRRILVSVHGFVGDIVYPSSRLRQKVVSGLLEPLTLRYADAVYCVSECSSKRDEVVTYARNSLGYVHNAVQIPALPTDRRLREELGFTEEDIVAITVCRMTKEKGIFDLLAAVQLLDQSVGTRLKLLLVGDGPELPALQQLSSTLRNVQVKILGKRLDVPDLLAVSDMFVFPSLHENLSNALLEAMSASLPVVATRVGGNPEVVVDGVTGLLVPPSSPEELAGAISALFCDQGLRARMGSAGLSRIGTHFSLPVLVKNLDSIYQRMLRS